MYGWARTGQIPSLAMTFRTSRLLSDYMKSDSAERLRLTKGLLRLPLLPNGVVLVEVEKK